MRLMLATMVKNETSRIERCLVSAAPWIDSWLIVDTGSTDDTKQKIIDFFKWHGIPGEIRDGTFEDWAQARNQYCHWVTKLKFAYEPDMVLLMDADMQLVVKDADKFCVERKGTAYEMFQFAGALHYRNSRLWNPEFPGSYLGTTHEYFNVPTEGVVESDVAYFIDHADGNNRDGKVDRDIALLKKGLKDEPNNMRYFFYLGNSYMEKREWDKAIKWYERRVAAGGWAEEQWQAQANIAHCWKEKGNEGEFLRNVLVAYNMRPSRAEIMYDAARWYRDKPDQQAKALVFAEAVEHLPPSTDGLFVNDYVYDVGVKEEISICANYVPGKAAKGLRVISDLSLRKTPYASARELARHNLYWYTGQLSSFCPSFAWQELPFVTPEHWTAMNPSVCIHKAAFYCNIRCVNYKIDDEGYYLTRRTSGEWTRFDHDTPIMTRNFVMRFEEDPLRMYPAPVVEAVYAMKVEFPLVIGFEDVRLFSGKHDLWCSATVRQLHEDGNCEQVLSRLEPIEGGYQHVDIKRMLRQPRQTEKNWSPIMSLADTWGGDFMYLPGEVVNDNGSTIVKHDCPWDVGSVRGSSHVIPWMGGWLSVIHEASHIPGSNKRWYRHRFIEYERDFSVKKISLPFVFHDRVIEFCAGMCWDLWHDKLVLSYGFKDASARIATIAADEVRAFLKS